MVLNGHYSESKDKLLQALDKLSIYKTDNIVVTKYDNEIIKMTSVSDRYEVFDIVKFMKENIERIEKNVDISTFELYIRGGIQYLTLDSHMEIINGSPIHKTFNIISSSDKSRKLRLYLGIRYSGFQIMGTESIIERKHLTGITDKINDFSIKIDDESFESQVENLRKLENQYIRMYNLVDVLIEKGTASEKDIFDKFINSLYHYKSSMFTAEQKMILRSKDVDKIKNIDIEFHAIDIIRLYMGIFRHSEPYIIHKNSIKILKITKAHIRNNLINEILDY